MTTVDKAAVQNPAFRRVLGILALVFAVLVALLFQLTENQKTNRIQLELQRSAASLAIKTSETLKFSIDNLHAVARFITHFPEIEFQKFQSITTSYFDLDSGLLILEWQPIVKNTDRQSFELMARENGLPNFFIWEPDILGAPTPVGFRDEYVPVYLMRSRYPEEDKIDTLGLDLAWSPERMESKWLARDTGTAQSSNFFPILLGPETNTAPLGFAITLPVYEGGDLPINQAVRRTKAIGYMAGVYELGLLLEPEFSKLSTKGINLTLSDASGNVLRVEFEGSVPSEFSQKFDAQLMGKTWTFDLTATEAMVADLKGFEFYLYFGALSLLFMSLVTFLYYQERVKAKLTLSEQYLEESNRQLEQLARHDPLTNLLNRRAFLERLDIILAEIERRSRPASLLMLDIDWFKNINDTHGHAQGDVVLKALASKCMEVIRRVDTMGRIGGEEFAIALPETASKEAYVLAERLRASIANLQVSLGPEKTPVSFTVSIGFASISEPIDPQIWLEQADHAMYYAKQSGRNRVSEYQAEMNPLADEPPRYK